MAESFGARLRRRRVEAGLSLSGLAARTHYSKGYLSKIETGVKAPGVDLARRCDAALSADGELSALVERSAAVPAEDTWRSRPAPEPAWDATPPALDARGNGLAAAVHERRIDSTLSAFRSQFDQVRRLGQWAPPAAVLPTVIAQTHTLRRLAAAADEPERRRLLVLTARFAEFAGWMAQEAGDDRAAAWWTRQSVLIAAPTGGGVLAAYALVRQAEISMYQDDAVRVIELARTAQASPGVPARIRGLAAQREAQGHALRGHYDDCRRTLDRAAGLFEGAASQDIEQPVLGSSTVPDLNSMVTAWCLHDLGRPAEAAEVLDRAVPHIPEGALRSRVRFGTRQALAHAAAGEVDRACALSGEMLDLVDLVDSATVRVDLRRLARTLMRWHSHPAVREVHPRLISALHTGTIRGV